MIGKSIWQNGAILGLFALITTLLIGMTFEGTEGRIASQQEQKLVNMLEAVIPQSIYDNALHENCVLVTEPELLGSSESQKIYRAFAQDKPVAVAIESIAPDGYSGKISLVTGVLMDGTVTGVRVIEHRETPGLGDKIDERVSDWILDFANKQVRSAEDSRWAVRKDGGEFDQFTGATITPRAVVRAVKNAVVYFRQAQDILFNMPNQCASQAGTPSTDE